MSSLPALLSNTAKRAAYAAAQSARILWYTGHYAAGRRVQGPLTPPGDAPYAEEFAPLDRNRLSMSFRALFRNDWKNIEAGIYKMPREVRTPPSPAKLWRRSRDYLRDAERVARRRYANGHSEVLTDAVREKYPRYYLQNFHFQTDGWMSASSAERYDMQVETLFTGAAGPMRRLALPFIANALKSRDMRETSLLDLGCGVGAFLADVKDNWPALNVTGLDLSPAYLGRARAHLSRWNDIAFVEGAAEETGLDSAAYDIVTAVYLFHELPPKIRTRVMAECARLLKPGGVFILVDTIQYGDEPGLDILLENFPRGFHEPYYDSYCRTDLASLAAEAGLEKQEETVGFLTKVTSFSAAKDAVRAPQD
ncbi:MAG: class I SAM-dependent methyltransferase [Pseudomonadota bacterium]